MPISHVECCDCMEFMRKMDSDSVDAVITDPPYSSGGNFRSDRVQSVVTKYIQTESIETYRHPFSGDNRDQRAFFIWCSMWMGEALRIIKPGGLIASFIDWRQLPTVSDAMQCAGFVWRGINTWWKPGIRMQRGRFSLSAEYLLVASKGEFTPGEFSPQNVYSCAPVGGESKQHIAEKPIDVFKWAISVTPKNSVILDPFMGSGTARIAAAEMDRDFYGCELDAEYFDASCKRFERFKAQLKLDLTV